MEGHKKRHETMIDSAETMARLEAVSYSLKNALSQIESMLDEEREDTRWDGFERRRRPRDKS